MLALDIAFENNETKHLQVIFGMIGRGPENRDEAISLFWLIRYNKLPIQWIRSVPNHETVVGKAVLEYRMGW